MSENRDKPGLASLWQGSTRLYIIIAAILVVVIVVAAILLVTQGLAVSARRAYRRLAQTATESAPTAVPTFTPGPTRPADRHSAAPLPPPCRRR